MRNDIYVDVSLVIRDNYKRNVDVYNNTDELGFKVATTLWFDFKNPSIMGYGAFVNIGDNANKCLRIG